jgi:hypothetical protein
MAFSTLSHLSTNVVSLGILSNYILHPAHGLRLETACQYAQCINRIGESRYANQERPLEQPDAISVSLSSILQSIYHDRTLGWLIKSSEGPRGHPA